MSNRHKLCEHIALHGKLYAYEGRVTIDQHLSGQVKPIFVAENLIPTVGRQYILSNSLANIDTVKIGDDGSARSLSDTDLKNPLFSASPTDKRVTGTKRITELLVGVNEANFTHREFGVFAGSTLISTLAIADWVKDNTKTRTYIHELGWF